MFQVVTHSLYLFLNPTHFMLSSRIQHTSLSPPPPIVWKHVSSAQKCWGCCFFSFSTLLLAPLSPSLLFDFITELWQLSSLFSRPQICISRFAGSQGSAWHWCVQLLDCPLEYEARRWLAYLSINPHKQQHVIVNTLVFLQTKQIRFCVLISELQSCW